MKFGIDWPLGFREEDVRKYWLYTCLQPCDRGRQPPDAMFSLTVLFSQYSPLLQVFLN